MKKLLTCLLAAVMLLSLAACGGGNDLAAAAREIEQITGEKTTTDDVKEAMEQLEALSGEKVTAQDVVDFTREMYEFAGGGDGDEPEPEENQSPSSEAPSEGGGWDSAEYAQYTGDIPEPAFPYTITGVIGNMGLNFKSDASADEFEAWRQTLLSNGFEENSVTGETWTVFNDTHAIAHSGSGYFNIQTK